MTKIYLVRHGEAEGNLYRRCQGWYDSLLTKKALERQIPAVFKRFSDIPLGAVYTSDIYRAHQTVRPIADSHHLELIPEPGFREIYMGDWEDRPWGELPILYPKEMDNWSNRPWEVNIPNGETYKQAEDRFRQTLLRLASKHEGQTILVGAHGSVIRSVLTTSLYGSLREMGKVGWCDNTGVSLLREENGKLTVDFYNDNSHLSREHSTLENQKWWKEENKTTEFHLWFRPVDLEADRDLFLFYGKEFYESAYGGRASFSEEEFLRESEKLQKAYPRALLFAMLQDSIYGLLRLDTEIHKDEGTGMIRTVVMRREARGMGYAEQLLGEVISTYRRMGRTAVAANVAEGNERAMRFYRKNGFLPYGDVPGHTGMKKDILVQNLFRK